MHPAYSVLFLTTLTGAGYGLVLALALHWLFTADTVERSLSLPALLCALLLITSGLLASTAHLGRPERGWRAFSQWRSSWLSREAVLAVLTYVPLMLWLLLSLSGQGSNALVVPIVLLSAVLAVLTVFSTAMIYASLRTIPEWHLKRVPLIYLLLSLASGLLLLLGIQSLFSAGIPPGLLLLCSVSLAAGALAKLWYWHYIDNHPSLYRAGMAVGADDKARVRVLDPPHTEPNYIQQEMGYHVGRKHAQVLRWLSVLLFSGVPIVMLLITALSGLTRLPMLMALIACGIGLLIERWLFFAEARHVVMLYYNPGG